MIRYGAALLMLTMLCLPLAYARGVHSGPAKAKSFKDGTGVYTFWGSAWATIGLVQAFPVAEPPPLGA